MDIALSWELVHPLLLQALVPIWKKGSNCSDSDIAEPPSKKARRELIQPSTTERKYSKKWEKKFSWLLHDEDINGALGVCKPTTAESTTQDTGGVLDTKLFQNWKKATERMKAHKRSSIHTQPVKPC